MPIGLVVLICPIALTLEGVADSEQCSLWAGLGLGPDWKLNLEMLLGLRWEWAEKFKIQLKSKFINARIYIRFFACHMIYHMV